MCNRRNQPILPDGKTSIEKATSDTVHISTSIVRELQHPERKLTLLMVSSALVFAFIGTVLGALTLAHLSGVPTNLGLGFFSAHPYLQIYGFIGQFVVGVAYSLLPRFKITHVPEMTLGYATYVLLTCANVLFFLLPGLGLYNSVLAFVASILLLGGSIIFATQVLVLAHHHGGGFPETNPLMGLSSLSLLLISLIIFLKQTSLVNIGGGEIFSPQMIFLALLGFAGSMIYTVEIRSVSFRQCNYRREIASLSWKIQAAAVSVTFASLYIPSEASFLSIIGGVLFLCAALSVILSIRIFEFAHPLMYRPAMSKMHFKIVRYNEVCILSGSLWLIFGCILGIVFLGQFSKAFSFFVRDSFIHSIAIGFIGSTITVFAPMLLPSLLGRKAPVSGLSFGPIALLNAGIILRVSGDFAAPFLSSNFPIWESASGPLVLGAMVWLLLVLPRIGKQHQQQETTTPKTLTELNSIQAMKNERDVVITVSQAETGRTISLNVWFAEKDGKIYFLSSKGIQTKWLHYIVASPSLKLRIANKILSGTAQVLKGRKEVSSTIDLFKDKYGERVYNNFYDGRVDRAVKVTIE
jgi:hypothetical protein